MKIARILLLLPILLLGTVLAPGVIHLAHAATGEVCLADPTTASSTAPCPTTQPTFSGPQGQQIRIGIYVQGSDALNGFDVSLKANHTLLAPVGIDLTGTILPGATTTILKCLQDVLKIGSVCASYDNVDTLHLVVTAGLGQITSPPSTGLLFTAIYNITGTTATGGVPVAFQTGCAGTSVTGGTCVTISSGSPNADMETTQAAVFDNSAAGTMPEVSITSSQSNFGPEFPMTSNTATITATGVNGYPSFTSPDGVTFTTSSTPGVTTSLNTTSCMTNGSACSVTLTLASNAAGNYTTIVSGVYATSDAAGNPNTLLGQVAIHLDVVDFGLTVNSTVVSFASGATGILFVNLSSLNGFHGSVSLSTGTVIPPSPPLSVTFNPAAATLASGATVTSLAALSASPTTSTVYHLSIRATSGTRVKTTSTLTVNVNTVHLTSTALTCTPKSIPVNIATTCTAMVTDSNSSATIPTGMVTFTTNESGTFAPSNDCTLSASATAGISLCQVTYSPTAIGNGTHTIAARYNGDLAHAASAGVFSVTVTPPQPDFVISPNSGFITTNPGVSVNLTISISPIGGFAGNVSLTLIHPLSSISCSVTPQNIVTSGTATLKCADTVSEVSNVTITGTSGNLTHSVSVIINVISPVDFSIVTNPTVVETNTGNNASSTITIFALNGFTGLVAISLTVPSGVFCTTSESAILSFGGTTLTCVSSLPGVYVVKITGTSGSLTHSTILTLDVLAPVSPPTGTVCIASETATVCPISPPVISGSSPPSQIRVAVLVESPQAFNGFDITLVTNSSVLKPLSVQLGTLLTNPLEFAKCIGGVNKLGSTQCAIWNSPSTIEYGVVGGITTPSVTGVLFYAVYNVTSTSAVSPITFQTGCAGTSVGNTCVSISSGATTLLTETAQGAKFSNTAYFDVTPSSPNLIILRGGSDQTQVVSVTSLNGFNGTIGLSGTSSPTGPTISISPNMVTLSPATPNNSAFATLNVSIPSNTPAGTYILTITARSGALPANTVTITLTVIGPDFSIAATPTTLTIRAGSSGTTIITIGNPTGFTGVVSLVANVSFPGLSASFNPQNITVSPRASASTSVLTISAVPATSRGNYLVTITATSGNLVHSLTIPISVVSPSFTIHSFPFMIQVSAGSAANSSVDVISLDGFNGTISLTAAATPSGITTSLNPTSVTIGAAVNRLSSLSIFTTRSTPPGLYAIKVTGTNGTISITSNIELFVLAPQPPSFSVVANPDTIFVAAGNNATSTISVISLFGFNGTVSLTSSISGVTTGTPPVVTLNPTYVTLSTGGIQTSTLRFITSRTTPVNIFIVRITGDSGNLTLSTTILVQVQPPPPIPPIARFTFSPQSPIVNQQVQFDGSASFDPDGIIVSWSWSPGDGFGFIFTNNPFFYHTYNQPGNYTVTLTVQDGEGLTASTTMVINVRPQPAHDVGIVQIYPYPQEVVGTEQVGINVLLVNQGTNNETVSVTADVNGRPVQTITGIFLRGCVLNLFQNFCYNGPFYENLVWNTTGYAPGNYTISATVSLPAAEADPTPADNSFIDGVVQVFPPPVITVTPTTGPIGTKVTVYGIGFVAPGSQNYVQILTSFDDMFLGYSFFIHNGTFTFTFDVPQAQTGVHTVKAIDLYSGARASVTFTVTPSTSGNLVVTINAGSVYFPGDTAVAYILTTLNGVPIGPTNVSLTVQLFFSNGTSRTMKTVSLGNGLFGATYVIPNTGPLGTYAIVAKAHMAGPLDASSLSTFEVKLNWLSSNKNTILTVGTLAGVLGLVAFSWNRGYLRRKPD